MLLFFLCHNFFLIFTDFCLSSILIPSTFLCLRDFVPLLERRCFFAKSMLIIDSFPSSFQLYKVLVEGMYSNFLCLFAWPTTSSGDHLSSKIFFSAKALNSHASITLE